MGPAILTVSIATAIGGASAGLEEDEDDDEAAALEE